MKSISNVLEIIFPVDLPSSEDWVSCEQSDLQACVDTSRLQHLHMQRRRQSVVSTT